MYDLNFSEKRQYVSGLSHGILFEPYLYGKTHKKLLGIDTTEEQEERRELYEKELERFGDLLYKEMTKRFALWDYGRSFSYYPVLLYKREKMLPWVGCIWSTLLPVAEETEETPFLATVERFRDDRVRCMVNFKGSPLPVAFPRKIIEQHNLCVGDEFDWYPAKGRSVQMKDCRPIKKEPVSENERIELEEFIKRGQKLEDILKKL